MLKIGLISLKPDLTGTIIVNASNPTPISISELGQNARYTFSGTANQLVTILADNNTFDDGQSNTTSSVFIYLYKQTDAKYSIAYFTLSTGQRSKALDVILPETGTYTILVDPQDFERGSLTLQVKSN